MKAELDKIYFDTNLMKDMDVSERSTIQMFSESKPGWLLSVFIIIAKVARFASQELLTSDGKNISIPKGWNLIKWFKVAKFFFVIIVDIVRAQKGKTVNADFGFNKGDLNLKNLKQ